MGEPARDRLRDRCVTAVWGVAQRLVLLAAVWPAAACRPSGGRFPSPAPRGDDTPMGRGYAERAAAQPGLPSLPTESPAPAAPATSAEPVPDAGDGAFDSLVTAQPGPELESLPPTGATAETVTIRIDTDPPRRAHVYWGPKDLGLAPLEIVRPRGSGPVELALRAPGYLTVHTRAFTERDDRIAIHLVPETDAPRMFGYRPR